MEKISVKKLVMGEIGTSEMVEVLDSVVELDLPEEIKAEEISGKIKLTRLEDTVLVSGRLQANAQIQCFRCLEMTPRKIDFELEREYQIDRKAESQENLYVDKYLNIDLTEPVREELILAIPSKNICAEECKGFCPKCGVDLNIESCKCK